MEASLIPKYSNILLSDTWISNLGDKYRWLFWSLPHGEISEPSQLYFSRKSLCSVKHCRWQHEKGKNQNCLLRENTKFASHYCCVFFPHKSVNNWKLLKLFPLLLFTALCAVPYLCFMETTGYGAQSFDEKYAVHFLFKYHMIVKMPHDIFILIYSTNPPEI